MARLETGSKQLVSVLATVVVLTLIVERGAHAEGYIKGQFGLTLPSISSGLSNVDLTGSFPPGSTLSDNALKSSILFGAKLGYIFPNARWFGLETEVFHTTSHIKEQALTVTVPSTPTTTGGSATAIVPGAHLRVLTWAPMNLVFRYPVYRLQPYVAVGPGIFFACLKDPSITSGPDSQSSTQVGLNAQVGLSYYITRRITVFGEWKFNYTRFKFTENENSDGFNATYKMHHVAFGIGYHF